MKVQNKETKEIVEAVKNDDGSYTVEGKKIQAEDMKHIYAKVIGGNTTVNTGSTLGSGSTSMDVVESTSEMSETIGNLGLALSRCQGEFEAVKKNSEAHNYNYADLEAVLAASRSITSKHELAVTQLNLSKALPDGLLVGVRTILVHSSGEWISSDIYVPAKSTKSNTLVQMTGVNITYLRRYGLQSILGLATTDTDGN